MKTIALKASPRTDRNTRSARRHRGQGRVPAVLYGGQKDGKADHTVEHLTVGKEELNNLLKAHAQLVDVQMDGKKQVCVLKEVQRDVMGDFVFHVDFERVDVTKPIGLDVELVYKGMPKGIAKGGHLRIEAYKLHIEALITNIPENITIKVDDIDLDQVLRLKDIQLPTGVKATADPETALCSVRAAIEEKEPVPGAAAEGPAEPELIGRKKDEEEEGAEGEAEAGGEKKEKK